MTSLNHINIVDVISGNIIEDCSIIIEDGKIKTIETSDNKLDKTVQSAKKLWAIPSFVDMHAHITFEGREHYHIRFDYNESAELSLARCVQNVTEALFSGVCLIRDVGAKSDVIYSLRNMIESRKILGPELILSGKPLCVESGHGYEFGQTLNGRSIGDLINNHLENNLSWLKIMNDPELFPIELLSAIVKAAHQANLKVAIHAFTEDGIKNAVQSEADTIEHAIAFSDEIANIARSNGTWFVPTLYCSKVSLGHDYLSTVHDKTYKFYLQQWHDFLHKNFIHHKTSKLPLLTGTDAGSAPSTFSDICHEIVYLHTQGISAIDALRSATIFPSKALGMEENYGSISAGKWANFILLSQNPLDQISSINTPEAIWYKGKSITKLLEN